MTDRGLLELSAKGAGIELESWRDDWSDYDGSVKAAFRTVQRDLWNPLEDDSDALQLVVKLGLSVWRGCWPSKERYVAAQRSWNSNDSMYYDDGVSLSPDPAAATRRAIVLAAAEIGRSMP